GEREGGGGGGAGRGGGGHDGAARAGGEAREAGELRARDREDAPALLRDDLVGARDVGRPLTLLKRERAHAGVRVDDFLRRHARVGQDPVHLVQEVVHLVTRGVQAGPDAPHT